jgi:hypothetical protein
MGQKLKKQINLWLILLVLLVICTSCAGGIENGIETKERTMTFSLEKNVYPLEFASYQSNSFVPVEVKQEWGLIWQKRFDEIEAGLTISPRSVLVGESSIIVKSSSKLMLFDLSGNFKFMENIANPTPVVMGSDAMAYFDNAEGLVYQDYDQKILLESAVPGFDERAYALLIRPTAEDVLGVVQDVGVRSYREKRFYIFRFVCKDLDSKWSYDFPGVINHALLTADEKMLACIVGETVTLYDAEDGKAGGEFKTGLIDPITASLSLEDELILIGTAEDEEGAKKFCKALTLTGEELWTIPLIAPALVQPPACGEENHIYLIDNMCLKCLAGGQIKWSTPPLFDEKAVVTVTKGNYVLIHSGAALYLYDPAGERIFESIISREGDEFGIPPAVDAQGRIYIISGSKLYCLG